MVDPWIQEMEDEAMGSLKGSYGYREGTPPTSTTAPPAPLLGGCPRCGHTWHGVVCEAKTSMGTSPTCGCPTAMDGRTLAPPAQEARHA